MHIRNKRGFSIFIIICLIFSQITLTHGTFAETARYVRLFGSDRYKTAVEISKNGWTTAKTVVIALGENFPDALCAGPLAKKYDAPILLCRPAGIDREVLTEIQRLGAVSAFVIGGTGAISENVVDTLKNLGLLVERIGGADRYQTSVKIAERLGRSDSAVIATGENYPDALSISSIAANFGMPILLTPGSSLPDLVQAYLRNNSVSRTYIIGGQGVISDSIASILPAPIRLSGNDRFETNAAVIKFFKDKLVLSNILLATGKNFADALTGAALAAKMKYSIILTDTTLPGVTEQFIRSYLPYNCCLTVIGGNAAVPQSIVDYILSILRPSTTAASSGSAGASGGTGGGGGTGGSGSSGGGTGGGNTGGTGTGGGDSGGTGTGGSTYTAVNSIELSAKHSMIAVGDSLQLTAAIAPSNATDKSITWSITGDAVGSVDNAGLLTASKSGIAEIIATTDGGKKSTSFKVTVGDISVDNNEDSTWYKSGEDDTLLNKRHVSSLKEAMAQKDVVPSNTDKGLVIVVRAGTYNEEAPIAIDRTAVLYGPLYNVKTGPGGRYSEEALINFNNSGGENGFIWPGFVITANNVEINGFTITCSSNSSGSLPSLNISNNLKSNLTKLMGLMEDNYKGSVQQAAQSNLTSKYSIPAQTGIGIVALGASNTKVVYNELYGMNFGMVLTNISTNGGSTGGSNISNNYIHGNRFGFVQGISAIENTTFKNNSIIGNNVGVGNLTAGKMDASCNWWSSGDERDITPLIIDLASILTKNKYYNVCYFPWALDSDFSTFADNVPYASNCQVICNDNNDLTANMALEVVNKAGNVITNLGSTDFSVIPSGADISSQSSNPLKVSNVYNYGTGIYTVTVSSSVPFTGNVDIYAKITDPKNSENIKSVKINDDTLAMVITGDTMAEGYTLTRISNPLGKQGEADGLDGDRNNSYAWSMAELGDYIYIGTNRNLMLSSALSISSSNLLSDSNSLANSALLKDPEIIKALVFILFRGDVPVNMDVNDPSDLAARIFRYNTKTGEIEKVYQQNGITGYRAAVSFTPEGGQPSVYFGSFGSSVSEILQVTTGSSTTVSPEPFLTSTGSATTLKTVQYVITTGSATTVVYTDKNPGSLRAMAVYDDQLYIGGISNNGRIYIKASSNPALDGWTQVTSDEDFKDAVYTNKLSAIAGGVWDFINYNGYLYVFISDPGDTQGFLVYKGKYVGIGADGANAADWKWTEVVGASGSYERGLGNIKNVTASPFLFTTPAPESKTYVYVGTFTSAPEAFIDGLEGNYDLMHTFMNPAQIYRFDENDNWQMIVGNPNAAFNKDKGNYLGGTYLSGFYNGSNEDDSKYMANHYIWRMAVYDNKLFAATFDGATLYDYVVPKTNSTASIKDLRKMIDFKPKGFDFFESSDGVTFSRITRNGFDDKYNYGIRTLLPTDSGLYIGTANPFYGAQLWKYTDGSETTTSSATTVESGLTDLQLQDSTGKAISLDKTFNPAQWSYNAAVGTNVDFIYVISKAGGNTDVSVSVSGGALVSSSDEDGRFRIQLYGGTAAEISVKVTDNSTKATITYTLKVEKSASGSV